MAFSDVPVSPATTHCPLSSPTSCQFLAHVLAPGRGRPFRIRPGLPLVSALAEETVMMLFYPWAQGSETLQNSHEDWKFLSQKMGDWRSVLLKREFTAKSRDEFMQPTFSSPHSPVSLSSQNLRQPKFWTQGNEPLCQTHQYAALLQHAMDKILGGW